MILIILLLSLIYFVALRVMKIDKPSKIVLAMFAGYWLFALLMSTTGYRGLRQPCLYTYFLFLSFITFFTIGFVAIKIPRPSLGWKQILVNDIEKTTKKRWLWVLCGISAIYIISKILIFSTSLEALASVGDLRTAYFEGTLYGPEFPYVNMFLSEWFFVLTPLFSYLLFKKRNILLILVTVFIFGYVLIGGGRFGYFFILLAIILMELVLDMSQLNKKKVLMAFSVVGVTFLFVMILITNARKGLYEFNEENLKSGAGDTVETLVTYSSGPIIAFDYVLRHNYEDRVGGYQYGRLTLSSVDVLIDYITKHIFGFTTTPSLTKIEFKQNDAIDISRDVGWNALYTAMFYFYLDFGLIGAFVPPLLFGLLLRFLMGCLYKKPNLPALVMLNFVFMVTIYSVIDYNFIGAFDIVLLYLMYVIWIRKRVVKYV